jgi:sigma-70-like protein
MSRSNFRESDDMDLSAIVGRAIKIGEQRGFITFDEINELMPSHTTDPEDIEALLNALSDHGIDVREA